MDVLAVEVSRSCDRKQRSRQLRCKHDIDRSGEKLSQKLRPLAHGLYFVKSLPKGLRSFRAPFSVTYL